MKIHMLRDDGHTVCGWTSGNQTKRYQLSEITCEHCRNRIEHAVKIDYTNHRGVRGLRVVSPISIRWGSTQWHTTPQWLLRAADISGDGTAKEFAMKDIHGWEAEA